MLFSVVIPLYNKARFIKRSLDSVLLQTRGDYEIIVVDDGSADEGPEIVAHYRDSRIKLIRQMNGGVSAARNRGIESAEGSHIAFLDADDAWKPEYLHNISMLIARYPEAGAYATAYDIIKRNGQLVRPRLRAMPSSRLGLIPNYFRSALGYPPVWTSAATVPKHIFQNIGTFAVGVPLGEDLDMWGRIALRYRIAFSSAVCASYIQDDYHPWTRQHYYFDHPEAAFVRTARQMFHKKAIMAVNRKDLHEYMMKLQIAIAYDCLMEGRNPQVARTILLQTRPWTAGLIWRKYEILARSYLPLRLLRDMYCCNG